MVHPNSVIVITILGQAVTIFLDRWGCMLLLCSNFEHHHTIPYAHKRWAGGQNRKDVNGLNMFSRYYLDALKTKQSIALKYWRLSRKPFKAMENAHISLTFVKGRGHRRR